MNRLILYFDEQDPAAPEEVPELVTDEGAASEPDYSQLLYEYMVNQDIQEAQRQEEIYAAYTEKLDKIENHLNWTLSFLVFFVVLVLFRSVRGWVTVLTGGLKDVY